MTDNDRQVFRTAWICCTVMLVAISVAIAFGTTVLRTNEYRIEAEVEKARIAWFAKQTDGTFIYYANDNRKR